ncbi:hypothetical protein D3C79_726490 [compost metagenome]
MARIIAQSIRLRKGWKIWKQNSTSTVINPARISTSSKPPDSALAEILVRNIVELLAVSHRLARPLKFNSSLLSESIKQDRRAAVKALKTDNALL